MIMTNSQDFYSNKDSLDSFKVSGAVITNKYVLHIIKSDTIGLIFFKDAFLH